MHTVSNYRVNSNNNSGDSGKVEPIAVLEEEEEEFFDALEEQEPVPNAGKGDGNNGLDKVRPIATSEKRKFVSTSVKEGKLFGGMTSGFNVPLSIFRYKGYDSDFFTSWYNILREIFEEIKEMCPEKRVLNLALSVLMLPYIASISLGLVVYSRSKADGKIQTSLEGNKTKKSEVSESTAKRLAYSVLAAIAILVNIIVLVTLIIPATLALATFYLLNKKLSHSLIATVKIGSGLYKNEHQNIEVSFHEINAGESDIRWDMEIKFPLQFEQLLRDLCEDKNDKLFVTQDAEHNTILKLSANIHLKNGLVPLRNEIRSMLATSIQGFTEAMGGLLKLDKKDITYDKLKELLNECRLKAVNSVDPKLTSHLIQDAYRVALIQAIKFAQGERKKRGDFILEERLKEVLVEQELKSQGKELPTEKEMILKDLEELIAENTSWFSKSRIGQGQGSKSHIKTLKDLGDDEFPTLKAIWKQLVTDGAIAERTVIGVYKDRYPTETEKALDVAKEKIEELKGMGEKRYEKICEELKKIHEDIGKNNLKDGVLKRKLEDLFEFKGNDQEVEKRLIKSRIRAIQTLLNKLDDKVKQSFIKKFNKLKQKQTRTLDEVNDFVEEMYLEITKLKMQSLLDTQKEGIKCLCNTLKLLKQDEPNLVRMIISYQEKIEKCLTEPAQLKEIIEKWDKDLDVEKKSKKKGSPSIELIELCLKNNQEILKALEDLELGKEGLLINKKTKNDYREELTSREKIKFAIIEDDLLKAFKQETFNEAEIKRLLEKAELEYCLAEKCIKYPVIKTKDNIKHFCQALLSPLIDNLVENIINNVPKNDKSILRQSGKFIWTAYGYIKTGVVTAIYGNQSTEGKALKVAHDTYKEVETFLQYFESSYEEVGGLIGNVFSDDCETFKRDIWPQIKNHLLGMWDRFSKDVEFTLISKDKNINQEIVETKLDGLTAQKHSFLVNSAQAAGA